MNQIQIGWVSGIFDGEGSIVLDKRNGKWRYPSLTISSTDIEILTEVKRLLGGTITGRKEKRLRASEAWFWKNSSSRKVVEILRIIVPHLKCPKKALRARHIINGYSSNCNGRYTPEEVAQKELFESEFYALGKQPIRKYDVHGK